MASKKNLLGLDILDSFFLVISLCGMIGFSYLLWDESFINNYLQSNLSNQEVIAEAEFANNDVRRRMQRSLTWYSLSDNEPIYEGDSLFTGTNSSTQVNFKDGVNIDINENSLVYLSKLDNELVLNLESGFIAANVKAKQKINLVQNGKLARLSANNDGRIQIQKSKDGALKVRSKDVSLRVDSSLGSDNLDNKNEEIKIDQNLKIEKQSFEIELVEPAVDSVILSEKINFKWKPLGGSFQGYDVEISVSPNFTNSLEVESKASELSWPVPQKNRRYYWRVKADSSQAQAQSSMGWFYISNKEKLQLTQPVNGLNLKLKNEFEEKEVLFSWTEKYQVQSYELQVSNSKNFDSLVLSQSVSENQFGPRVFTKGRYFWRVRGVFDSNKTTDWSDAFQFKLEDELVLPDTAFVEPALPEPVPQPTGFMGPPAPENPLYEGLSMQKPVAQSSSVHTLDFKDGASNREPQSLQKFVNNPPNLNWIKVKGAQLYQLEIANDKTFKSIVASPKISKPNYIWKTARPGEYYWRVQALGEMGQIGPWSDIEKIVVQSPTPKIKGQTKAQTVKSVNALNEPEPITVQWQEVPFAQSYMVEITDMNSGKSRKINNNDTRYSLNMTTGQSYKVRVAAIGEQGRSISSISDYAEMSVKKTLELSTPKPLLPQDGVTMVSFDDAPQPVLFKWSKVKGAEEYVFEISDSKDFKKPLVSKKLKKNDYLQTEGLPKKQLYWRVKSVYKDYSSEFSESRAFGF